MSITDRRTQFFPGFPSTGNITFESVKFRGRYLVFDENKGKLRLGDPVNGSEQFEIAHFVRDDLNVGLRAKNGCYVAFDFNGELIPCVTDENSHTIRLHLRSYQ